MGADKGHTPPPLCTSVSIRLTATHREKTHLAFPRTGAGEEGRGSWHSGAAAQRAAGTGTGRVSHRVAQILTAGFSVGKYLTGKC